MTISSDDGSGKVESVTTDDDVSEMELAGNISVGTVLAKNEDTVLEKSDSANVEAAAAKDSDGNFVSYKGLPKADDTDLNKIGNPEIAEIEAAIGHDSAKKAVTFTVNITTGDTYFITLKRRDAGTNDDFLIAYQYKAKRIPFLPAREYVLYDYFTEPGKSYEYYVLIGDEEKPQYQSKYETVVSQYGYGELQFDFSAGDLGIEYDAANSTVKFANLWTAKPSPEEVAETGLKYIYENTTETPFLFGATIKGNSKKPVQLWHNKIETGEALDFSTWNTAYEFSGKTLTVRGLRIGYGSDIENGTIRVQVFKWYLKKNDAAGRLSSIPDEILLTDNYPCTATATATGIHFKAVVPAGIDTVNVDRSSEYSATGALINSKGVISISTKNSQPVTIEFDDYFVESGKSYNYSVSYRRADGSKIMKKVEIDATAGSGEITLINNPSATYDSAKGIITFDVLPEFTYADIGFDSSSKPQKEAVVAVFGSTTSNALIEDASKKANIAANVAESYLDKDVIWYGYRLRGLRKTVGNYVVEYCRTVQIETPISGTNVIHIPAAPYYGTDYYSVEKAAEGIKINVDTAKLIEDFAGEWNSGDEKRFEIQIYPNYGTASNGDLYKNYVLRKVNSISGISFTEKNVVPGTKTRVRIRARAGTSKDVYDNSVYIYPEAGSGLPSFRTDLDFNDLRTEWDPVAQTYRSGLIDNPALSVFQSDDAVADSLDVVLNGEAKTLISLKGSNKYLAMNSNTSGVNSLYRFNFNSSNPLWSLSYQCRNQSSLNFDTAYKLDKGLQYYQKFEKFASNDSNNYLEYYVYDSKATLLNAPATVTVTDTISGRTFAVADTEATVTFGNEWVNNRYCDVTVTKGEKTKTVTKDSSTEAGFSCEKFRMKKVIADTDPYVFVIMRDNGKIELSTSYDALNSADEIIDAILADVQ